MVKSVKFTRDSGCLARNEFLVISEGDHTLIYIFVFFFSVCCWALYCTTLAGVGFPQL